MGLIGDGQILQWDESVRTFVPTTPGSTPGGSVSATGTLTNNALVTGHGTAVVQTPSPLTTLDANGRLILGDVPVFNLSLSSLATSLIIPLSTTLTVPVGKTLSLIRLTMAGGSDNVVANAGLASGLYSSLKADATSTLGSVTYGVVSHVTNDGLGTGKALHAEAIGGGSTTGVLVSGNFQLEPRATSSLASASIQTSLTGGVNDVGSAILITAGSRINYGVGSIVAPVPYNIAAFQAWFASTSSGGARAIQILSPAAVELAYWDKNGSISAAGFSTFGDSSNTNPNFIVGNTGSPYGVFGTLSNHDLEIRTNNTEKVHITAGGNLGIGTNVPVLAFHVFGAVGLPSSSGLIAAGIVRFANTSGGGVLDFGQSGTSPFGFALQAHSSADQAVNNPILLNPNGGNVGIGTTTPGALLDIAGNLIFHADNSYDIGAVGATRPRTGYFGTSVITPSVTVSGLTAGRVVFAGFGGLLSDDADMTFSVDTFTITKLIASASAGIATAIPRRPLDVLSTSQPQIRLTYTDNSVYTDFQTNSAGNLLLTPTGPLFLIASTVRLQSSSYVSQTTGYAADGPTGAGDFRYLFVDELHAKSFIADLEFALAGGQVITKSTTKVAADFTLPAAGSSGSLTVEEFAGSTAHVFVDGDLVQLRQFARNADTSLNIGSAWGTVTYVSRTAASGTTPAFQTYTFARPSSNGGSATGTINIGTQAIDYGTSANKFGYWETNAVDGANAANSPYSQIVTSSGAGGPAVQANRTVRTRIGNLNGITGVTEYGLYAGNVVDGTTLASTHRYIRLTDSNFELNNLDLNIYNGGNKVIALDYATPYFSLGATAPTSYLQASSNGIWMGNGGSSIYKMRVGAVSSGSALTQGFTWDGTAFTIIGNITATTGTIGGFTIGATSLTAGVLTNTIGLDSGGSNPAFYAGSSTPSSAPFRVTNAGVLTATSGTVGGWALGVTRLSSANVFIDQAGQYISMGTTPPTSYGTNVGVYLEGANSGRFSLYKDANNYFQWDSSKLIFKGANTSLDSSGNFTATSATLTGAITATSGAINGPITMSGSTSSIAIGSTPPTSATAGTGVWLDRTGLYGLASNDIRFMLDAATGKLALHAAREGGIDWNLTSGGKPTSTTKMTIGSDTDLSSFLAGFINVASGTEFQIQIGGTTVAEFQSTGIVLGGGSFVTPNAMLDVRGNIISSAVTPLLQIHDSTGGSGTADTFLGSFDGGGTSYATFAINRSPATGTFTNTGRAHAQFQLLSSNLDSSFHIYTSAANNTFGTDQLSVNKNGLVAITRSVMIGSPTGGDKGPGTGNFQADVYKQGTAFTNPAWVFEHHYTGKIKKFVGNFGAQGYEGLLPLNVTQKFVEKHYELPQMARFKDGGMFDRGEMLLASVEESYLYIFELSAKLESANKRISELERVVK